MNTVPITNYLGGSKSGQATATDTVFHCEFIPNGPISLAVAWQTCLLPIPHRRATKFCSAFKFALAL